MTGGFIGAGIEPAGFVGAVEPVGFVGAAEPAGFVGAGIELGGLIGGGVDSGSPASGGEVAPLRCAFPCGTLLDRPRMSALMDPCARKPPLLDPIARNPPSGPGTGVAPVSKCES